MILVDSDKEDQKRIILTMISFLRGQFIYNFQISVDVIPEEAF